MDRKRKVSEQGERNGGKREKEITAEETEGSEFSDQRQNRERKVRDLGGREREGGQQ